MQLVIQFIIQYLGDFQVCPGILLVYQSPQRPIIDLWQIYKPKYFHPPTFTLSMIWWWRGEGVRGRFCPFNKHFLKNGRIIFYWPIDFDWFPIYWMVYDGGTRRWGGWVLMDVHVWMDRLMRSISSNTKEFKRTSKWVDGKWRFTHPIECFHSFRRSATIEKHRRESQSIPNIQRSKHRWWISNLFNGLWEPVDIG